MAKSTVTISGIPRADGEYEFELEFTGRDLHKIKQISGVRAGEFEEAFKAGDADLAVAFAAVVLPRHGKNIPLDVLWDAPLGAIKLNIADAEEEEEKNEEADAGPPSQRPTEQEEPPMLSANEDSSGNGSSERSDLPAKIRPVTGVPSLDTGSASGPATSAI